MPQEKAVHPEGPPRTAEFGTRSQDLALRQDYQRLKFRRGHAVAKVAIARKLAVRMYWMLRSGADYARLVRMQGSPGATLLNASSSLG